MSGTVIGRYIPSLLSFFLSSLSLSVHPAIAGNVYAYMPSSVARDIFIVLMVLHQVIVFGLFSFPLYFMAEKALGVHEGVYWKRVAVRLPIALLLWLIALAFPFFGVINDLLGAFTTTFEVRDYLRFCFLFSLALTPVI